MEEISFNWGNLERFEEEVAVILDLKRCGGWPTGYLDSGTVQKAGEGDDREQDGWMASPAQWT